MKGNIKDKTENGDKNNLIETLRINKVNNKNLTKNGCELPGETNFVPDWKIFGSWSCVWTLLRSFRTA